MHLAHELRDDTVEDRALEVQRHAGDALCPVRMEPMWMEPVRMGPVLMEPEGSARAGGGRRRRCGLPEAGGRGRLTTPFSPVHSARKFSAVLGVTPPYSPKVIRCAGSPPMLTSKNTRVVTAAAAIRAGAARDVARTPGRAAAARSPPPASTAPALPLSVRDRERRRDWTELDWTAAADWTGLDWTRRKQSRAACIAKSGRGGR